MVSRSRLNLLLWPVPSALTDFVRTSKVRYVWLLGFKKKNSMQYAVSCVKFKNNSPTLQLNLWEATVRYKYPDGRTITTYYGRLMRTRENDNFIEKDLGYYFPKSDLLLLLQARLFYICFTPPRASSISQNVTSKTQKDGQCLNSQWRPWWELHKATKNRWRLGFRGYGEENVYFYSPITTLYEITSLGMSYIQNLNRDTE